MFTKEDIRDIAVKIENNAEKSYRKAAEMTTNNKLRQTLQWMADQEREHAQRFANMVPFPVAPSQNRQLFEMGHELLLATLQDQTFSLNSEQIAAMDQIEDVLERSIEFENDTILFYEMLREFTDDPAAIVQIEAIIMEEREHIDTIRDLTDAK